MRHQTLTTLITIFAAVGLTACGGHDRSNRGGAAAPAQQGGQVVSVTPNEGTELGTNTIIIQTAGLPGTFDPATDQVLLGGNPLTGVSTVATDTLSGIAPAGSGTVDVTVVQGGVQASLANAYTYRAAELTAVSPAVGPAGSAVTIDTRFFAADFLTATPQVDFGGVPATSVTALTGATVQAIVPAGTGAVDVTVTAGGQSATLAAGFTYGQGSGPGTGPGSSFAAVVARGPENPGMLNARPGATGLVVGQIRVSASAPVTLTGFALAGTGAIDEGTDLGDVVLYHDQNGNGRRDANEPQLGAGTAIPANDGQVVVSGLSLDVDAAQPADILIAVEIRSSANIRDNVSFLCDGTAFTAVRRGTTTPVTVGGAAVSGVAQVVGADPAKTYNLAAAPNNPAARSVAADAAGVPVLALRATTTTGELDLHTLELRLTGSAAATAVASAQLGVDRNTNGDYDAGDTSLGVAVPSADGRLRWNFHGQRLTSPSATHDLVVELTLSGTAKATETIGVELKHGGVFVHAYYDNGGQQITLTPSTLAGGTLTISTAANRLVARAGNAAAAIAPGNVETLALALDLTAGDVGAGNVTGVTVRAQGSLDDVNELSGVALYADTNNDGLFSAGVDQRIAGPTAFTANDGTVTLTPAAAQSVAQASTARLFVTATLNAGVAAGKTVTLSLTPATDVAATPSATGDRIVGSLLVSGAGSTAVVQPGTDLGKDTYLRGEGLYLNDNFGHTNSLPVGDRYSGQLGERLFFIQLPLPTVPAGATIRKAYVALYLASTAGLRTGVNTLDVQAFQVQTSSNRRTPWLEGRGGFDASLDGIVYDGVFQSSNRPDMSQPDTASTPLREVSIARGSEGRWVLVDVTSAAQAWYAGTAPNHGLKFRDKDFRNHDDGSVSFYSSDYSKAGLRPVLLVEHQ